MADLGTGVADGFIGAGLALVGKIVFDWLKNGKKNGNGTAVERSVEYWEKFREIIRDELHQFEERRSEAIRRIVREEIPKFRRN
jgi:hypothetical protein